MNKALLSSGSDNWATPKAIYDYYVKKLGYFDPCPYNEGEIETDGLAIEWCLFNFVNPPYSNLKKWVEKAIAECKKGHYSILLIPARTDTKAFKMISEYGANFAFITGRLHFNGSKNSAPFPSVLIQLTGGVNTISFINSNDLENYKEDIIK